MDSIHPLQADDLEWALDYLAGSACCSRSSRESQFRAFREYLAATGVRWVGWVHGTLPDARAIFFALLIPGRTAVLLRPGPEHGHANAQADEETLRHGLAELPGAAGHRLHYAQALLDAGSAHERPLLARAGFRPLARLVYMERAPSYPWVDPPPVDAGQWLAFEEARQAEFERVLQATDEDSRDCPALTGLRPPGDVLLGHRAAGEFDPRHWEILGINGTSAGCILLSRLPWAATMEIVYVGLLRPFRGQGAGRVLLQRALQHSRAARVERVVVVVDEQNAPARRLYERLAFVPVASRDALLYRWE